MRRLPSIALPSLTLRLQTQGPQTAAKLAASIGVDRSQISRLVGQAGQSIQRIGGARRARYALRRPVRSAGTAWLLYRIGKDGRARESGRLESFHGGWRLQWSQPPPAWSRLATDADGWAEGFPFFLDDLRPQGFVGCAIARRLSASLSLPADPTSWGDDEVLAYLQSDGDDLPGNFVVGDAPLRRALAPPDAASAVSRPHYPALAASAVLGGLPGSSVAGEQPKFLATLRDGDLARPVLVKFSASLATPAGRRWADLLLAEAIASEILAENGEGLAGVQLLDAGDRRFLEVPRFDRLGAAGSRGVISLAALLGTEGAIDTTDWVAATERFEAEGIVSSAAAASVRRRRAFGELIGNSDMHPGNLSFFLGDTLPLDLTPSYDMLPMLWAPVASGEIVERMLAPLPPIPRHLADWSVAAQWAERFWTRLAADPRLYPEFAAIAHRSGETVSRLRRDHSA